MLHNLNLSYIHKNLDSLAEKVKDASHLKNDALVVEVFNKKHLDLLRTGLLGLFSIKVDRHNVSQLLSEVVRTTSLDGMFDERIHQCLSDMFVSKAHQLLSKNDEQPVSLHTIFLMFEFPMLPTHIYVGCERYLFELMYYILSGASGAGILGTLSSMAHPVLSVAILVRVINATPLPICFSL